MNYRFSVFLFIAVLAAAPALQAQSRIAYLDATKLVKRMPEAVDAESRLDQITGGWNKEISTMEADLKRKRDDYERKRLIMTDAERNAVEMDMTDLKKRIDQYRQDKYGSSGELYKQQAELMKPAYDKLLKAIEEVALDGKYDYVFDRGANDHAMLYTNAKFDLTVPVAKKLGLETNDIFNIPLSNPLNSGKPNPNNPNSNNPNPNTLNPHAPTLDPNDPNKPPPMPNPPPGSSPIPPPVIHH